MSLTEKLVKKIVGNRPEPVSQPRGLENFASDLRLQLAEVDYKNRLDKIIKLLILVDSLTSWKPDSKSLAKGAPVYAVVLLALLLEACDFSPPAEAQTGAQPEKPKPTIMVTNPPAPEDYEIDIDPSLKDAAGMVLTVEAQTNSEPAPTSTNTPEPSPTVRVPESMTKIVFSTNVNKRLGPGTNYGTTGSFKNGDQLDFSKIIAKYSSGGYTWLKLSEGLWFALVPGVSYDTESVRHLPDDTSIPVAPTRTPTRVPSRPTPAPEVVRVIATITNNTGSDIPILTFTNKQFGETNHVFQNNTFLNVLRKEGTFVYVQVNGVSDAVILATVDGLTYVENGNQTVLSAPTPIPNPETATTYTGSYWGGTEVNGQTVYRSFDLNNPVGNLLQYDQYGYFCLSPISKLKANYAVEYGGNPINFPHVGKVINKLVNPDGSITVTLENNYVFQINSSTLWYVQLQTLSGPATGATACVHSNELMGAFNGINVGNIVGHDGAHAVLVGIP